VAGAAHVWPITALDRPDLAAGGDRADQVMNKHKLAGGK
jgi:hypothetical protein